MRIAVFALAALGAAADAAVITQWNFNSVPSDGSTSTGTLIPGTGLGTASLFGGNTATFASGDATGGSTDPNVGDDSAWNTTTYAAQGTGSGTRGVQFMVSTAGVTDGIYVTYDARHSNTSSRFTMFQYTLDGGTTWSSAGLSLGGIAFDGVFEASSGGDFWYNDRRVDLFGVAAASNNPLFGFRITPVFKPGSSSYEASTTGSSYGTSGTLRYDMVTVNTPAPGAAMLAVFGGLLVARRRR